MKKTLQEYDRLQKSDPKEFWKTYACRVGMPEALKDAMQHGGTVWSGMEVVVEYKAVPLGFSPPAMLIQTQYDFGAAVSQNWRDLFPIETEVMLENCAHYPHLEDGATFGKAVSEFMQRHDV
jgi:pimeloyl-ACP methyl ester carboxylesterase